jgi:hypothetical protein
VFLHQGRPQGAGGAQLGDLHEEVHADVEEEAEPGREGVDREALGQRRAHVFEPVGQREGELLHQRRAGLLDVVAGDRDRVEARHLLRGVFDDVGDDPHRGLGRVDVGVADHELFEDIVLDGAAEARPRDALLLAGRDEHGEDRQHRAVHRHRHRHLVERDLIEQDPHVLDRIDRHARLADVAGDARMVGIVAAVGRKVEGDRQPLLPAGERLAVERVRVLGGREAGILADRPRALRVHRRARAAGERREAGQRADMFEALQVFRRVERLDRNPLRRVPGEVIEAAGLQLALGELAPVVQRRVVEVGHQGASLWCTAQ